MDNFWDNHIRKLDSKYNLGLRQEELEYVSASFADSIDISSFNDEMLLDCLNSAVMNYRTNPLRIANKRIIAEKSNSVCPICNGEMESVTLRGDRKVKFCSSHKVTIPLPVEGQ